MLAMSAVLLIALLGEAALGDGHGRGQVLIGAGLPEPYQDGLVLGLFSLVTLALVGFVSAWSLRPLDQASAEARRVGPAAPDQRISADGMPAELQPLVAAVNGALSRMSAAIASERRFTENAAHELRTPLAVLSLRLQRARASGAPDWPAIEADLAGLQHLVASLLDLAHKARPADAAMVGMNLSRAAREAAAMVLPLLEAEGRALIVDLPERVEVRGRPEDMRDAVRNLLENAARHGRGTVRLSANRAAGQVRLVVIDQGEGIPPALAPRAFDRFAKGERTDGSGLGLAIVREVALAHRGTVGIGPEAPSAVWLSLPEADQAGATGAEGWRWMQQ